MATKIVTKNSSTASAVPTASDLVQGELAVNVADKRLFTEDNGGAIVELGTNPSGNVTFQDNGKAIFGAGSDLQIYHDGSNSLIKDVGAGDLNISAGNDLRLQDSSGNNYFKAGEGGSSKVYYAGAEKLATTATGIDVTGTATMDGLTVESAGTTGIVANISNEANEVGEESLVWVGGQNKSNYGVMFGATPEVSTPNVQDHSFIVKTNPTTGLSHLTRLKVSSDGDISFYEDTGTTPKLFWDASAESLGIGTSSPDTLLNLAGDETAVIRLENTNGSASDGDVVGALQFYKADGSGAGAGVVGQIKMLTQGIGSGGHLTLSTGDASGNDVERLRISSNGRVGIGTSSPDTLLEIVGADPILTIRDTETAGASTNATLRLAESGASDTLNDYWDINYTGLGALAFKTKYGASLTEAMRIDSSGRVGIGTSSPVSELDVAGITPTLTIKDTQNKSWTSSDTTLGELAFRISDASGIGAHNVAFVRAVNDITSSSTPSGALSFGVAPNNSNASEAMRIDSSGNVGIGTSSPSQALHVESSSSGASKVVGALVNPNSAVVGTGAQLWLSGTNATTRGAYIEGQVRGSGNKHDLIFATNSDASTPAERMRIGSSGNMLVGKSVTSEATVGHTLGNTGYGYATANSGLCYSFNRLSSDGEILRFRQNTSTVGSIGTVASRLFIGNDDTFLTFQGASDRIYPASSSGGGRDAAIDLGASGTRFKDLYLSGGVYLGGTGAANLLDDYEEGTWTPEIVGSTTAGSYSSTIKVGAYTKVGQIVTVHGYFYGTSGTGSGDLNITGLPFTISSDAVGVIQNNGGLVYPSGTVDACLYGSGSTTLTVRCNKSDGTAFANMAYPTSASYVRITLTYKTNG